MSMSLKLSRMHKSDTQEIRDTLVRLQVNMEEITKHADGFEQSLAGINDSINKLAPIIALHEERLVLLKKETEALALADKTMASNVEGMKGHALVALAGAVVSMLGFFGMLIWNKVFGANA